MSSEQSLSIELAFNKNYLIHVFRNMHHNVTSNSFRFYLYDYYAAVYDSETIAFLGEIQLSGAVLGSTKERYLIALTNEGTYEMQLLEIQNL